MIRFHNVEKSFGSGRSRVLALRGIDLLVPDAQMCSLVGPSGAGKSTVLHLAGGLTSPDLGSIHIGDRDITSMSATELTLLRRRDVGIVFQFFNLLPYLSAWENIALPLRLDHLSRDEERERVGEVLELVGLGARSAHRPAELSGGEMQRVAVARALVIRPRLVLADEPTGNLDTVAGRQIMELLRDANEKTGVTTVVVTHDPVWASVCDRVVRLVDGEIVEDLDLGREDDDGDEPEPDTTLH